MIDSPSDGVGVPVSIPSEHGLLYGELALLPNSPGIIVLLQADIALDKEDQLLARLFQLAGFSTLSTNLSAHYGNHSLDIHTDVHSMTQGLLGFLDLIKKRKRMGEIDEQRIGLFANNEASPVAVRIGALRDRDIAAIVCYKGLVDLAGAIYLHSLASLLLFLTEEIDTPQTASNRRALKEITCHTELRIIPEIKSDDMTTSSTLEFRFSEAAHWFNRYLAIRE